MARISSAGTGQHQPLPGFNGELRHVQAERRATTGATLEQLAEVKNHGGHGGETVHSKREMA
jgi:hypothetical protein